MSRSVLNGRTRRRARKLLRDSVPPAVVAERLRVPQSSVDAWVRQLEASESVRSEMEIRLFLAGPVVPTAFALLLTALGAWGWIVVAGWPTIYVGAWVAYLARRS